MKGVYEDFAESFNLYINHHELFRYLSKNNPQLNKKFVFLDTIFNENYFSNGIDHFSAIADDKRPWDTTKLR